MPKNINDEFDKFLKAYLIILTKMFKDGENTSDEGEKLIIDFHNTLYLLEKNIVELINN